MAARASSIAQGWVLPAGSRGITHISPWLLSMTLKFHRVLEVVEVDELSSCKISSSKCSGSWVTVLTERKRKLCRKQYCRDSNEQHRKYTEAICTTLWPNLTAAVKRDDWNLPRGGASHAERRRSQSRNKHVTKYTLVIQTLLPVSRIPEFLCSGWKKITVFYKEFHQAFNSHLKTTQLNPFLKIHCYSISQRFLTLTRPGSGCLKLFSIISFSISETLLQNTLYGLVI